MKKVSYLDTIKGNRSYHVMDRIVLITGPILYLIIIYLYHRFITDMTISSSNIMLHVVIIALVSVIVQARALGRDNDKIESLIVKEISPLLEKWNNKINIWKVVRKRYMYLEIVPSGIVILYGLFTVISSVEIMNVYFIEIIIILLNLYVFLYGLSRFLAFRAYTNEIIQLYNEQIDSDLNKDMNKRVLMNYKVVNIVSYALLIGVVYYVTSYSLLEDLKLSYHILYAVSFSTLFVLAKGLYDAYKGFYDYLSQLDDLRSAFYQH